LQSSNAKVDTAISAKKIKEDGVYGRGAIASKLASEIYGLDIIAEGIETNPRNYTRFLILEQRPSAGSCDLPDNIDKSSICFSLTHEFGSLSKVLSILAFYNLNLTKIQSMPIIGREWEYFFHVDLVFDNYRRYKQALDAIGPLTSNIEILGEYHAYETSVELFTNQD
jgi:prephenate dehydratase